MGESGDDGEPLPGEQGGGAGESRRLPRRTGQPERCGAARCRTVLQSRAETLLRNSRPDSQHPANAHPTLALV